MDMGMVTTTHTVILQVNAKVSDEDIHRKAHEIMGNALFASLKDVDLILGETVVKHRGDDLIPYTLVEVSVTLVNNKARLASKTNPQ